MHSELEGDSGSLLRNTLWLLPQDFKFFALVRLHESRMGKRRVLTSQVARRSQR